MKEDYEVILKQDGSMKCRRIIEVDTTFPQGVLDSFLTNASIHLGRISGGSVFPEEVQPMVRDLYMSVSQSSITLVVQLAMLRFLIPIRTLGNGMVTPLFQRPDVQKKEPLVTLEWDPSMVGIPLYFGTQFKRPGGNGEIRPGKCYLFAKSGGSTFRLPTSNVYEDCSICMGDYDNPHRYDVFASMGAHLLQFHNSDWNSDLLGSSARAEAMFRFKPVVEGEGFVQQGLSEDWTNLCGARVGHGVLSEFVATLTAGYV